jgi:integrase/recombinase XerD
VKSTRKFNEENERVKRAYMTYLRDAKGYAPVSVDKVADALLRLETAIGMKPFKNLSIEDAKKFKDALDASKNQRTGKQLSAALRVGVLTSVRAFVLWLADRPGFKSRIRHSDAAYFSPSLKEARIAHARRPIPHPSPAQAAHAFRLMPDATAIDRRNKALFALMMLTGARIAAAASLTIGHIDLKEGSIFQDGRNVNTKFSKSFTTWFLPIDPIYLACLTAWIAELRGQLLFGNTDPLFPRPKMMVSPTTGFQVVGLTREHYASEESLRKFIKEAFTNAGLPPFSPHRFRNTLVELSNSLCTTPEEIKALSMNLGHERVSTTIDDYGRLSPERQGEVIKAMRRKAKD